jgi:hypothetical protein
MDHCQCNDYEAGKRENNPCTILTVENLKWCNSKVLPLIIDASGANLFPPLIDALGDLDDLPFFDLKMAGDDNRSP